MTKDNIDDFGFTALNLDDIESGNEKDKATRMFESIQPLLNNLESNDEREYIYWPNRAEKIQKFREKLQAILDE